jgi:hypothetical protein
MNGILVPGTITSRADPHREAGRGGRKQMQPPDGAPQPQRTDSSWVKALARAVRWTRMLEPGTSRDHH